MPCWALLNVKPGNHCIFHLNQDTLWLKGALLIIMSGDWHRPGLSWENQRCPSPLGWHLCIVTLNNAQFRLPFYLWRCWDSEFEMSKLTYLYPGLSLWKSMLIPSYEAKITMTQQKSDKSAMWVDRQRGDAFKRKSGKTWWRKYHFYLLLRGGEDENNGGRGGTL